MRTFILLLITLAEVLSQGAPFSRYVEVRDGTKIAVDVHLPTGRKVDDRHPTLFEITRYGRGYEGRRLGRLDRYFLDNGYALAKVDARGSGASFGTRPVEYGPEEVRDGFDLVEWAVKQPWCDGNIGAYGTSYTGTTAELLAASNHPAVKAVIPGWSDFDLYVSPARPYGLIATSFIRAWSGLVAGMDRNDVSVTGASIRKVDGDVEGKLLAAALEDHKSNPDVFDAVSTAEFRDDKLGGRFTWDHCDPRHWKEQIERSKVPMLVLVSWMDAGTADGALLRFQHFSNPQKVLVLASSHGGGSHASPYKVSRRPLPPEPNVREQFAMRLAFFDHHLKGAKNDVPTWPAMRYYNLGEEAYRTTDVWPPKGTSDRTFHLREKNALSIQAAPKSGSDTYETDPKTTTGRSNRWMAQFGRPVLRLDDRGAMDARMLTYTSAPLDADLQISGTPVVSINVSSDAKDGVIFAYLEDVDADDRSRYVTEGGLRLIHRKLSKDALLPRTAPYHSFKRVDAAPMTPGRTENVTFQLWPIAARIKKGHRIRVAFACADADTFDPIPGAEKAMITVTYGGPAPSLLRLPVSEGH